MEDLEKGFICKNEILESISEEEIFELVFKFKPIENIYVKSPFRKDKNPGCTFKYYKNRLRFIDFASKTKISIDCFEAVQNYFKLGNFFKTLEFIDDNLLNDNIKRPSTDYKIIKNEIKRNINIQIKIKNFNLKDKVYWSQYGISKRNLIEDKVFSLEKYRLLNTKYGTIIKTIDNIGYSYTNFENNKKKLYFPYQKKRFITNCKSNDIGEINRLPKYGKQLIISKSYKDCRVLRNKNLNSIWFQNELITPSMPLLINLCKRFTNIIVFFDNDTTGISNSLKVKNIINSLFPGKADNLYISETLNEKYNISDPADMYHKLGEQELDKFINTKIRI